MQPSRLAILYTFNYLILTESIETYFFLVRYKKVLIYTAWTSITSGIWTSRRYLKLLLYYSSSNSLDSLEKQFMHSYLAEHPIEFGYPYFLSGISEGLTPQRLKVILIFTLSFSCLAE